MLILNIDMLILNIDRQLTLDLVGAPRFLRTENPCDLAPARDRP